MVKAYTTLVLCVGMERLAEMAVSRRNTTWSLANGGHEVGAGHFPAMVALHGSLLAGCLVEVAVGGRRFSPTLGWPMLGVVVASQALRWWCIAALGPQWNTRVIVVPGENRVVRGPYRWLRHPNYVAVVAEGVALPMVHSAWGTAALFTTLNAALLRVRIRVEESALTRLRSAAGSRAAT